MEKAIPSVFATTPKEYHKRFELAKSLSKRIHLDVMDGKFVRGKSPKLTILKTKGKEIDAHLMVAQPNKYIADLKKIGVRRAYIHFEIKDLLENIIEMKESGINVGLAISPKSKIEDVLPYSPFIKSFIVMGVVPGKEGQEFIASTPARVSTLRRLVGDKEILVDGGMNIKTVGRLPANTIPIAGSSVSTAEDPKKEIALLRKAAR